ncbi:response regulator [Aliikangiella marina]|uniref:histidine kinase n=1 Tax=Aliikangiella marina TaxID=1712262 RepID=A0A545TDG8_9GAMM|nr:hybrid sensor histidine kinase/response regulator [Aliikangiella marina]TQV75255.1 response regulator [Aliikangiella marina]
MPSNAGHSFQRIEFTHLGSAQGLSQATVFDMVQDSKGFVWLATQQGVNRYDGYEFRNYKFVQDDPSSLSNSFVLSLHIDSFDRLWVGTRGGLNLFDYDTETFTRFTHDVDDESSLPHGRVTALAEDSSGTLWVGTGGGGIASVDLKNLTMRRLNLDSDSQLAQLDGLVFNPFVTDLMLDEVDNLWIASGDARLIRSNGVGGLMQYNTTSKTLKPIRFENKQQESIKPNSITALYSDNSGTIWVGSEDAGLFTVNQDSLTANQYFDFDEVGRSTVSTILKEAPTTLWFGTVDAGLFKYDIDNHSKRNYRVEDSLSSNINENEVVSLMLDFSGVFWVGTWNGGVNKIDFKSSQFHKHLRARGEANDALQVIRDISEDSSGNIWLAAWDRGAIKFNRQTGETLSPPEISAEKTGRINGVQVDPDDVLWIATDKNGLFRYDIKTGVSNVFRNIKDNDNSLAIDQVLFTVDGEVDQLWIGTRGGGVNLLQKSTGTITRFPQIIGEGASVLSSHIGYLFYENDQRLWVGTEGDGLYLYNPSLNQVIAYYRNSKFDGSLCGNNINGVLKDANRQYWIATAVGLCKVHLGEGDSPFETLTFELIDDDQKSIGAIGGIVEDDQQVLWISTIDGVSSLSADRSEFKHFSAVRGVIDQGYFIRAKHHAKNGSIFFGSSSGLTEFLPSEIVDDLIPPKPVITKLMLFNQEQTIKAVSPTSPLTKSIVVTDKISLTHKQNVFSFEFSGLHFSAPDFNQYRYHLKGFNDNWLETDANNRRATYTNLDPGTYVFEVVASNQDGTWSKEKASIEIEVFAAPWLSWWAKTIYVLVSLGLLLLFYRQKIKADELNQASKIAKLEMDYAVKSNELKSMFLANMSHEIRTPMNAIIGLSGLALGMSMDAKLRDYLNKIQSSSNALLRIIDDILDYSKIEANKLELEYKPFYLEEVVREVVNVISPKANEKGLEVIVSNLETIDFKLLGDQLRVRQVLINLVSNAIKFTDEGFIELHFDKRVKSKGKVEIKASVIDTGIGLTQAQISKIFTPFTQADMTTTRRYGGTGLGLSLSRDLVNLMGGEINVSSSLGRGTVFSFNLMLDYDLQADVLYQDKKPFLQQLNVLVIEDNPETLVTLIRMLESFGIQAMPYLASDISPRQLRLSKIDFEQFNLIMVDATLPGAEFSDIGAYLRQTIASDKTHVLLMTAMSTHITSSDYNIFDTIIEKPVTPSELHDGLLNSLEIRKPKVSDVDLSDEERHRLLAKLASKHILVVEDNAINQQVASELISSLGIKVDCADNGRQAIEKLKQQRYDMVFMDIQMPVLDGPSATKIIREQQLVVEQPIVAMTAHAMVGDREKCLQAGMDDYLSKPIKPDALYQCIQSWLLKDEKPLMGMLSNLLRELVNTMSEEELMLNRDIETPDSERLVDFDRGLQSLDGNRQLFIEVLEMFVQQYRSLGTLEKLLEVESQETLGRFFHTLKGLADSIGAMPLKRLCEAIEHQVNNEGVVDHKGIENCLYTLVAVCHQLEDYLDAHATQN